MNETEKDSAVNITKNSNEQHTSMSKTERSNTVAYLYVSYVFVILFTLYSFIYLLVKRNACKDDKVLASHISWQLKTIIYSVITYILMYVFIFKSMELPSIGEPKALFIAMLLNIMPSYISSKLAFILLGFLFGIFIITPVLWAIYRVIKGITNLADNKPMYQAQEPTQYQILYVK